MGEQGDAHPPSSILLDEAVEHLRRWWRPVVASALVVSTVTATIVMLRPRTWAASGAFVAQARTAGGVGDLAAQAGGVLGALSGLSSLGGSGRSPEFYAELLKSREIMRRAVEATYADSVNGVIRRRSLIEWYAIEGPNDAVRRDRAIDALRRNITTSVSRPTGMITFTVRTRSAALAGQLGAQLLQELQHFNQMSQQRQAEAERQFVEQRLQAANSDLERAERRLQLFMSGNREFRSSPALALEQERLGRDVQLRQQLFISLAQAAERARLEAVRDTPMLSVLEAPEVPSLPQPRHLLTATAVAVVVGAVVGLLLAYVRDLLRLRTAPRGVRAPSGDPAGVFFRAPSSAL